LKIGIGRSPPGSNAYVLHSRLALLSVRPKLAQSGTLTLTLTVY